MDVGAGVSDRKRRPLAVADNLPLRAMFAAIGGVWPGLRPPKSARTEQLSSATLDPSISFASPSSSSNTRQTFSHTPAKCQSRNRRQHVMPLPQPSSFGKYSQGQPVRMMKRMPVSALRFGIGGRPPLGLGCWRGRRGSIRNHNSSVRSGLAISGSSLN
jgi:hypothetical protein